MRMLLDGSQGATIGHSEGSDFNCRTFRKQLARYRQIALSPRPGQEGGGKGGRMGHNAIIGK